MRVENFLKYIEAVKFLVHVAHRGPCPRLQVLVATMTYGSMETECEKDGFPFSQSTGLFFFSLLSAYKIGVKYLSKILKV